MTGQALLDIQSVALAFGGVVALNGATFQITSDELCALIGPNGAGKTSLLNCINGFYRPQKGSIRFSGEDITRKRPHLIAALGVARTFQNVEVLGRDTVIDNILLGRHMHFKEGIIADAIYFGKSAAAERENRERVLAIIDFLGLTADRFKTAGSLPYGRQKLVEIGRALAMEPRLLLLDEPTSGMTPSEKDIVANVIRKIRTDMRVTQLLIEHDMGFVRDVCERAVVLNFGAIIADGSVDDVLSNPIVIDAYLGAGFGTEHGELSKQQV